MKISRLIGWLVCSSICMFFIFPMRGQDILQAQKWYDEGVMRKDSALYSESIQCFEKAANLYSDLVKGTEDSSLWESYVKCLNGLGISYSYTAQYDHALLQLKKGLGLGERYLGNTHLMVANLYNSMGVVQLKAAQLQEAMSNLEKALQVREIHYEPNHPKIATVINNIGVIYKRMRMHKKALDYFNRALKMRIAHFGEDDLSVATSYNNVGIIYWMDGKYQEALFAYQKALDIRKSILGSKHHEISKSLNNLGALQHSMGIYDAALTSFFEALDIKIASLGKDHPEVAAVYNNIGIIYQSKGELNHAKEYFLKVLEMFERADPKDYVSLSKIYNDIGVTFLYQKQYDNALNYFSQSFEIQKHMLRDKTPELAGSYSNIGFVYLEQERYDLALENFRHALRIQKTLLGERHPQVANSYGNIGTVYWREGKLDSSLIFLQTAYRIREKMLDQKHPKLVNNKNNIGSIFIKQGKFDSALSVLADIIHKDSSDWQQALKDIGNRDDLLPGPELVKTMSYIAKAFYFLYSQDHSDKKNLQLSYDAYCSTIHLIEMILSGFVHPKDKQKLLDQNFKDFEGAIQMAFRLGLYKESDSLLQQAFSFSERSKSIMLREYWRKQQIHQHADIPQDLLTSINDLSSYTNNLKKARYQEQRKGLEMDSVKLLDLQAHIYEAQSKRDSLIKLVETFYPAYFNLNFKREVITVTGIQETLSPDQSLIEYFQTENSIFVFLIQKDTFLVKQLPIPPKFSEIITAFRHGMLHKYDSKIASISLIESPCNQAYQQLAYQLYQILLEPLAPFLTEGLIIIPDADLSYLPFDALLTDPWDGDTSATNLPFLIRKHRISYAFSATLLQEMQQKQVKPEKTLLAMAPSFPLLDGSGNKPHFASRGSFAPLIKNKAESKAVAELFSGDVFLDQSATRATFLRLAHLYKILHLSTHGLLNDSLSQYSFLAFFDSTETSQLRPDDPYPAEASLYLADLYHLQLNAEMVVLSACETGIGNYVKGEGIASLARGFSYAGVKSIITTLWSISDQRSMSLMVFFYEFLAGGYPKDEALRLAKLRIIEEGVYNDPYYWAGFISIGDMEPISTNPGPNWMLYSMLLILFCFGMWRVIKIK